jgi:aryl-alcohol dehydrogenase-like predicted oxidoreductase
MEHVNLGKTVLKVSRLCLGCMTYGSSKWREWVLIEEKKPAVPQAVVGSGN